MQLCLQRRCDWLNTESAQEIEARLQEISACRCERFIAAESVQERKARLQEVSAHQCERLAAESAQEREARLQWTKSIQISL